MGIIKADVKEVLRPLGFGLLGVLIVFGSLAALFLMLAGCGALNVGCGNHSCLG
jgi:hypothetical protein